MRWAVCAQEDIYFVLIREEPKLRGLGEANFFERTNPPAFPSNYQREAKDD